MIAKIEKIAQDLQQLKKAHVVEPFNGPALLSGRAAAVFFMKSSDIAWKASGSVEKTKARRLPR